MRPFLKAVSALTLRHCILFVAVSVGLGQALNLVWPMDDLTLYQILFIPAIVYAFFEIKSFVAGVEEFRAMIASHPNRTDGDYIDGLLACLLYTSPSPRDS